MGSHWWDIDVCNKASEVYLCGCIPTHFYVLKVFFNCGKIFVVVHLLSHVQFFETPWTAARPGFPVLHHLLELAQTHVHWVNDAIQPSHPLSPPSPPALNFSHQGNNIYNMKFVMVTSFILESFRSCQCLIYSYIFVYIVYGVNVSIIF